MHSDLIPRRVLIRFGIRCQLAGQMGIQRCWRVELPDGRWALMGSATLRVMVEKRIQGARRGTNND